MHSIYHANGYIIVKQLILCIKIVIFYDILEIYIENRQVMRTLMYITKFNNYLSIKSKLIRLKKINYAIVSL